MKQPKKLFWHKCINAEEFVAMPNFVFHLEADIAALSCYWHSCVAVIVHLFNDTVEGTCCGPGDQEFVAHVQFCCLDVEFAQSES